MGRTYFYILFFTLLTFGACNEPDRGEEALALYDEIVNEGIGNVTNSLERVDSAEQAGVFTVVQANTVRATIYEHAGQRRMAEYYAEEAIAAEQGHAIATSADSVFYCMARYILADGAYTNGEFGKSLTLSQELLAFVGNGTSAKDLAMKCRAL